MVQPQFPYFRNGTFLSAHRMYLPFPLNMIQICACHRSEPSVTQYIRIALPGSGCPNFSLEDRNSCMMSLASTVTSCPLELRRLHEYPVSRIMYNIGPYCAMERPILVFCFNPLSCLPNMKLHFESQVKCRSNCV